MQKYPLLPPLPILPPCKITPDFLRTHYIPSNPVRVGVSTLGRRMIIPLSLYPLYKILPRPHLSPSSEMCIPKISIVSTLDVPTAHQSSAHHCYVSSSFVPTTPAAVCIIYINVSTRCCTLPPKGRACGRKCLPRVSTLFSGSPHLVAMYLYVYFQQYPLPPLIAHINVSTQRHSVLR